VTDEPPIEIDKPISHKSENLDTLFDYRVLNIRNPAEQKIFTIRADMVHYIREFLRGAEFVEIDTPKLLGAATEGGAEVFELNYFDQTATLAQSPQFYKQIMVGAFERVFEINHAYRAEPSATTRHMTESTMLDIEIGFVDSHDEVLDLVGDMTTTVLKRVYDAHGATLRSLGAPELKLADGKIPRFSVAEIHAMYSRANNTDTTEEKDLTPDEERWISEHARKKLGSDLVFATDFPTAAAKFYHKIDAEKGVALWADLLFRGVEIATCPLRENSYDKMIEQMTAAGLDVTADGKTIGTPLPQTVPRARYYDYYHRHGVRGDKKLVYRTELTRRFPYPRFPGERYVGLNLKYLQIDLTHTLLALNEPLCVVEYQPDGSSRSMLRQYWRNPRGFLHYRKALMRLPFAAFGFRLRQAAHLPAEAIILFLRRWVLRNI
jgi:elongation factor P--beta-lysine ligase